jgi:UDP-glucose 4-epimerase
MGISKAFMEKTVLSHSLHRKSETDTKFCITRYGNVMASRGSVIPHFVKQAMAKNELTVTNPNMTRFLMSLQESIELVLYAFNNASSGEICVQKASGTTISNLAHAINERYDNDQPIKIIGARHGEKLHEVLLSSEESSKSKEHGNFYVVPPDERDLNYTKYFSDGTSVMEKQSYTSANTTQLNIEEVKRKIETILKPIEEQL